MLSADELRRLVDEALRRAHAMSNRERAAGAVRSRPYLDRSGLEGRFLGARGASRPLRPERRFLE
jgi:hypothetical protein